MTEHKEHSKSDPWLLRIDGFHNGDIALNGNRFLLGNGYMGYRGTLEEFGSGEQAGCMLNGVYDQVPGKWREPVNAPNGWFTRIDDMGEITSHTQTLDMRNAVMERKTTYSGPQGNLRVTSRRFVSADDIHLLCLEYTVSSDKVRRITIRTEIDTDVWDINGPHLQPCGFTHMDDLLLCQTVTRELGIEIAVCEKTESSMPMILGDRGRIMEFDAEPDVPYTFKKYVSIHTSLDTPAGTTPAEAAASSCSLAAKAGFDALLALHQQVWNNIWESCDVVIHGDDEAQFALRYSLYQLQLAAPRHSDRVSIPARGLSGQVYKGAVFWDTEMFMTPVFSLTAPEVARNLILYRYHTLDGARRKAAEYGFRGAFFAWESQETGDDACTHFNVTDVFTGRPMRTYFRDKQIHISADIVYATSQYLSLTGDESILAGGAAELVAECARFLFSYACYKPDRNRYELLDVTGPDEYHERVGNNAYTNRIAKFTLDQALALLVKLERSSPEAYRQLDEKIGFIRELPQWRGMAEALFLPQPHPETRIIPQFDGYHALEDVTLEELKSRVLDPNEYLGGGNGPAAHTRILKQADVVLMLNLFPDDCDDETVRANWEFYEPRTEHGSSLSACAYSMVAARIGKPDWAYRYFMKTATVDLSGKSKQFVGPLYIGGTHPAANGGAWLSAVFGFAGLRADNKGLRVRPSLPSSWSGMEFHIQWHGRRHKITITGKGSTISPL